MVFIIFQYLVFYTFKCILCSKIFTIIKKLFEFQIDLESIVLI